MKKTILIAIITISIILASCTNQDITGAAIGVQQVQDGLVTSEPVSIRVNPANHLGTETTKLFFPYVDFRINGVSYNGNPFDVVVNVVFTHTVSGEEIRSLAFYDGDWDENTGSSSVDDWVIRFTGTRLGEWTFVTSSSNPDLNGYTGTINVVEQDNPNVIGPVKVDGTWFSSYDYQGNEIPWFPLIYRDSGRASGYQHPPPSGLGDYSWDDFPWSVIDLPYDDDDRLHEMIDIMLYGDDAQLGLDDLGINVLFLDGGGVSMMHHGIWEWPQASDYWDSDQEKFTKQNPDLRSFYIIENVYSRMAEQGISIKMRLWDGSWSHLKSPDELEGGINGVVDKRLQRYMAARLGPLLNFHYDYGADLYDGWVTKEEIHEWSSYLKENSGWLQLHAVREWEDDRNPGGFWLGENEKLDYVNVNEAPRQRNTRNDISRWPFDDPPSGYPDPEWVEDFYDLTSYWRQQSGHSYPLYYGAIFLYKRTHGGWSASDGEPYEYWTMDRTRKFLWQAFMQEGGFASWGRLWQSDAPFYPNPEQFKIFSTFVDNYLKKGYSNAGCSTDGYCLTSNADHGKHYIFYKEDAGSVQMDLSGLSSISKAVAVNTRGNSYQEINIINSLNPGTNNVWNAPQPSDWALYIER